MSRNHNFLSFQPSRSLLADLTHNRSNLPENRARLVVLITLLYSSIALTTVLTALLFISYFIDGNQHVGLRVVVSFFTVLYLIIASVFANRQRYHLSALMLVILYGLLASLSVWQWGIQTAFAILMMAVTVTLAGILLGARYAFYGGIAFISVLVGVQILIAMRIHLPDVSWQNGKPSEFGELSGHILLLTILALVSWLFGRQSEEALHKARQAEAALTEQKETLARHLKERTAKLKAAQLKEMRQLYRFAEMGQLTMALFHDLANHLAVLTLDLENLKQPHRQQALDRAHESIGYIEALVDEVRRQLNYDEHPREFNCVQCVLAVIRNLQSKSRQAGVEIRLSNELEASKSRIYGDPTRFEQIMTVLITNAIDECMTQSDKDKPIEVLIKSYRRSIEITVSDWGGGIAKSSQSTIFQPFNSSKDKGMGIGLFIARQIIETHFRGRIVVARLANPTVFKLTLPQGLRSPRR